MNEHYENYDMDEMEIDLIDFLSTCYVDGRAWWQ